MLVYFTVGLLWSLMLEIFTTTQLENEYSKPWAMAERVFHTCLWPYSFLVFIYALIKEFISKTF